MSFLISWFCFFFQLCHFYFDFDASAASVCISCFSLVCVSFYILVLSFPRVFLLLPRTSRFVPHFLSQNPVEPAYSRSLLQRTSFYILRRLPFPPMYFLFLLHSRIPYFPCLSCTSPKILLSMPCQVPPPCSVLSFIFLYPSFPYFPVLWILRIVSVMCFSSPFLLGFS